MGKSGKKCVDRFSKNFKFNLKNNVNLYRNVYDESGRAVNSKNLFSDFLNIYNTKKKKI